MKKPLALADISSRLESIGTSRIDQSLRPDGMNRIPWEKCKEMLWDVTCDDALLKPIQEIPLQAREN